MGKRERNESESMVNKNQQTTLAQNKRTDDYLWNKLPEAEQQARGTRNDVDTAYKGYMGGTGSFDPESYGRVSAQNQKNISTGGYNDPEQLSQLKQHIGENVRTGGYTDDEVTKMGTGGLDPANAEKVRGNYQSLIDKGGLSDDAADAMRRQAAGTTASIYSTLGSKLTHSQATSGYGGAGGETAQLARDASIRGAEATTGANAEIGKIRQSGIVAGTGGLSKFEVDAAEGNRKGMETVAKGRLAGTGYESDLAANQAHNTIVASGTEQDLTGKVAFQRMEAAGGLQKLYESSPGYVNDIVKQIITAQNSGGQLSNEQTRIMQELSKQPGLYQNILAGIQTATGGWKAYKGGE